MYGGKFGVAEVLFAVQPEQVLALVLDGQVLAQYILDGGLRQLRVSAAQQRGHALDVMGVGILQRQLGEDLIFAGGLLVAGGEGGSQQQGATATSGSEAWRGLVGQ